jgi:hypothetical protein
MFSKQIKSQTILRLYLIWKNWTLWNRKLYHPVFVALASVLDFLHICYLIFLGIFCALKYIGSSNLHM